LIKTNLSSASLFEVHVALEFESEISTFILIMTEKVFYENLDRLMFT
jgi:hypothetical protein